MSQDIQKEGYHLALPKQKIAFASLSDIHEVTESLSSQLTHQNLMANSLKITEAENKKEEANIKILENSYKITQNPIQQIKKADLDVAKSIQAEINELVDQLQLRAGNLKREELIRMNDVMEQKLNGVAERLKMLSEKVQQNRGMQQKHNQLREQYSKLWKIKMRNTKQLMINDEAQRKKIKKEMQKLYRNVIFPQVSLDFLRKSQQPKPFALKHEMETITQFMNNFKQIQRRSLQNIHSLAMQETDGLRKYLEEKQKRKKQRKKILLKQIQDLQTKLVKIIQKQQRNWQYFQSRCLTKIEMLLHEIDIGNSIYRAPKYQDNSVQIKMVESTQQIGNYKCKQKQTKQEGKQIQRGIFGVQQNLQSIRIEQQQFMNNDYIKQ